MLPPGMYPDQGGVNSALNLTAAAPIKGGPGRLVRVTIMAATTGAATFNDCTSTGTATAANAVLTIPTGATVGTTYYVDWPCQNGITLSAPGGGTFAVAFS